MLIQFSFKIRCLLAITILGTMLLNANGYSKAQNSSLPGLLISNGTTPSSTEEVEAERIIKEMFSFQYEKEIPNRAYELRKFLPNLLEEIDDLATDQQKLLREKVLIPLEQEIAQKIPTTLQSKEVSEQKKIIQEEFFQVLSSVIIRQSIKELLERWHRDLLLVPFTMEGLDSLDKRVKPKHTDNELKAIFFEQIKKLTRKDVHQVYLALDPLLRLEAQLAKSEPGPRTPSN